MTRTQHEEMLKYNFFFLLLQKHPCLFELKPLSSYINCVKPDDHASSMIWDERQRAACASMVTRTSNLTICAKKFIWSLSQIISFNFRNIFWNISYSFYIITFLCYLPVLNVILNPNFQSDFLSFRPSNPTLSRNGHLLVQFLALAFYLTGQEWDREAGGPFVWDFG